jgi:riboflavin biosynthesis pyrimidine reductase
VIAPLRVLCEEDGLPRWQVPDILAGLYGGAIGFEEPCLVANFVASLDGVVALPGVPRSHALVADESEADRFVLALLRACADAILVGPGTLRASPRGTWRVDRAFPAAAPALAELRAARGRPTQPSLAVVTSGRSFDAAHPALAAGALVVTTEEAAAALRAAAPATVEVVAAGSGQAVDPAAALALLRERGFRVVLSEAGPRLFGSLLAAGLVDELFLTVSPLVAGRSAAPRLALVEGLELLPGKRVAGRLRSVRAHGSHLFLRYGLQCRP